MGRKSRVSFSEIEDQFIIDNHISMVNSAIGTQLNRSDGTIASRKKILLNKGRIIEIRNWKPPILASEKEFLTQNYWTLGAKECAKRMNRLYITILNAAKRMGLKQDPELSFNHQDMSHFFDIKDPFVAYFLGYFWADGTIRKDKPRMVFKIKQVDFNDLRSHLMRLGTGWIIRECRNDNPEWSTLNIFELTHKKLYECLRTLDYHI